MRAESLEHLFVDRARNVIKLCLVAHVVRDITVYRVISGFWYAVFVILQRLE